MLKLQSKTAHRKKFGVNGGIEGVFRGQRVMYEFLWDLFPATMLLKWLVDPVISFNILVRLCLTFDFFEWQGFIWYGLH